MTGPLNTFSESYEYLDLSIGQDPGQGIKVGRNFGWRDVLGKIAPKASGAGSPSRTQYYGANVYDYSFALNDVCDINYHIPHDYVPASDLHFHVHWSHNGTNISGNVVFTLYWHYAKGFDQQIFHTEKSTTITYNTTDLTTTPRYQHRVDEVKITAGTADANNTLNTDIEPDGMILGVIKVTTLPTITGGNLFIHEVDLHYQSTNMCTANKAPDFWL